MDEYVRRKNRKNRPKYLPETTQPQSFIGKRIQLTETTKFTRLSGLVIG